MKNKHINPRNFLLLSAILGFALAALAFAPTGTSSDIAVIVNPSTPISNLSVAELRAILSGDRRSWDMKTPAVVLMRLPGSHERDVVLQRVLKQSESDYKKFWVGKIFRGEVIFEPATAPSAGLALDYVSSVQGAISFVDSSQVQSRVKLVKIDGKLPGDSGYPLH
jgi:ABC-type phosphate transport system substrate-binding protein